MQWRLKLVVKTQVNQRIILPLMLKVPTISERNLDQADLVLFALCKKNHTKGNDSLWNPSQGRLCITRSKTLLHYLRMSSIYWNRLTTQILLSSMKCLSIRSIIILWLSFAEAANYLSKSLTKVVSLNKELRKLWSKYYLLSSIFMIEIYVTEILNLKIYYLKAKVKMLKSNW